MEIVDYPFTVPKMLEKYRRQPYLPVRIINPNDPERTAILPGLVDSGSFRCRFPIDYANLIGLDVRKGRPDRGDSPGGTISGYLYTCSIDILEMDSKGKVNENSVVTHIPKTEFSFGENLPFALLGVEEFLTNFVLTIDYPRQVFSIQKPTES